tara:strand:- start:908 stop:1360 length:453 start_codon:yes stop_codon:yes gene_type:complete
MEQSLQELMTIGVLAKEAGVGVETIRFYQRKGLLKTPQRTSGFRKYTQADLRRIKFIKRVQGLGFTLNDAQSLLDINACSPETQPLLEQVCIEKIDEIEKKIADLNRILGELRQFHQSCGCESSNNTECRLLECFENDWECCDTFNGRKK